MNGEPTPVMFATIERGGRYLKFFLDREWSCPLHDHDVNECDFGCDDDRGEEYDDEFECNACRGAGWRVVYDADGWATIHVVEVGPWETMLRQLHGPLVEATRMQHASNILLAELARPRTTSDVKVRIPLHRTA